METMTEAIRNLQRDFRHMGLTPPDRIHLAAKWQGIQLISEVEEWCLIKAPTGLYESVRIDGTLVTWPCK